MFDFYCSKYLKKKFGTGALVSNGRPSLNNREVQFSPQIQALYDIMLQNQRWLQQLVSNQNVVGNGLEEIDDLSDFLPVKNYMKFQAFEHALPTEQTRTRLVPLFRFFLSYLKYFLFFLLIFRLTTTI